MKDKRILSPEQLLSYGEKATKLLNDNRLYTHENGKGIEIYGEPLIISKSEYLEYCRIVEGINLAQSEVVRSLAQQLRPEFAQHAVFNDQLKAQLKLRKSIFLSRYDFIVGTDGKLKVIEFNSSCPAGMTFLHRWRSALAEVWPDSTLTQSSPMLLDDPYYFPKLLLKEMSEKYTHSSSPNVVLVTDNSKATLELENLKYLFSQLGARCKISDLSKLKFHSGYLYDENQDQIDLVYCKMRPPRSVLCGWGPEQFKSYSDLLEAAKMDAVCIINPFSAMTIGEDKGLLAAMQSQDFQNVIPTDVYQIVQEHLATTAFITPDDLEQIQWLQENKDILVIKPRLEGRGHLVTCGNSVSLEKWEATIQSCEKGQWIVQKFVPPATNSNSQSGFSSRTLAIYVIDGKACGMMGRVSKGAVNNIAENGKIQPIYIG